MARQKFAEGDVFAIPLGGGGFARGVIARKEKAVLLGYFFGPKVNQPIGIGPNELLEPSSAILIGRFGDSDLKTGVWPVTGKVENWSAAHWPIPQFVRVSLITGETQVVEYEEGGLGVERNGRRVSKEQAAGLPEDGYMGSGYIELVLTDLVN